MDERGQGGVGDVRDGRCLRVTYGLGFMRNLEGKDETAPVRQAQTG